jgi:DNA-damage-inducible protein J
VLQPAAANLDIRPAVSRIVAQGATRHDRKFRRPRPHRRGHQDEAAAVLASMGLSLSDAFRLLLKRVAAEKSLPFESLVPNAETVEAMKAARRGAVTNDGKPAALLTSLNADC